MTEYDFVETPYFHAWKLITRLGEAQILLPVFFAMLGWLMLRQRSPKVAATWFVCVSVATLLTTITKVAFIGWGVGYAPLDFTGISGHSMFAAALMPILAAAAASTARNPAVRRGAVALGYGAALVIMVSRVIVHAHSVSEAVAGMVLGSLASAAALSLTGAPRSHAPKWMLVASLAWFVVTPVSAPRSLTHDWVTRLSLVLSGHPAPYTRAMMRERYRQEQQALLTRN